MTHINKKRQNHIEKLIQIAYRIDEKATQQQERSKKLQRMATLANQGLKESQEFKLLEQEFKYLTVTDYGDEVRDLQKVVKQLRK